MLERIAQQFDAVNVTQEVELLPVRLRKAVIAQIKKPNNEP